MSSSICDSSLSSEVSLPLPEDLGRCHEIIEENRQTIREKEELIQALETDLKLSNEQIEYLRHKLFGRRSEKMDAAPGQLTLFDDLDETGASAGEVDGEADQGDGAEEANEEEGVTVRAHQRRGRKPLPKDLPRKRLIHDLSDEDKTCSCCEKQRPRIGEEVTEQLEYRPASLHIIEHVQYKYGPCPCKQCPNEPCECEDKIDLAEKPAQPIEKGLAGPGLLAHVITSKYCDHLPLHRQQAILGRQGVDFSRQTLCDWVLRSAAVLEPVALRMKELILSGDIINTDDTPVPTLDPKNKGSTHRSYLWVYIGDETHPFIVYDFTWTRSGIGPREFLGNFEGYIQADAFGGYDALFDKRADDPAYGCDVVEVACWAHARRKFHEATKTDPARAHEALNRIRGLYNIEKQARRDALDATAIRALRREKARPILEKLFDWMKQIQPGVLPKSPLGKALTYALGNEAALRRYVDVGELAIDNNAAERALRPVVIGRKNYLFAGSPRGGRAAAILYSLIQSARRHGHDPFNYLRDLLTRIPTHPQSQLDELLPDRWRPIVSQD